MHILSLSALSHYISLVSGYNVRSISSLLIVLFCALATVRMYVRSIHIGFIHKGALRALLIYILALYYGSANLK